MLQKPYIPSSEYQVKTRDPNVHFTAVEHPVTLEGINNMLALGLYATFEDFTEDLKIMFKNSKKYFSKSTRHIDNITQMENLIMGYTR